MMTSTCRSVSVVLQRLRRVAAARQPASVNSVVSGQLVVSPVETVTSCVMLVYIPASAATHRRTQERSSVAA